MKKALIIFKNSFPWLKIKNAIKEGWYLAKYSQWTNVAILFIWNILPTKCIRHCHTNSGLCSC